MEILFTYFYNLPDTSVNYLYKRGRVKKALLPYKDYKPVSQKTKRDGVRLVRERMNWR